MKLYTNAQSRGNTILPLLKELEIEAAVELIEILYDDMRQPEYLTINPMGKVPCLVDGDVVISETAAIFAYLADKYIEKGLAPALNDPKRGEYFKWLFFCHGPMTEYMDIKSLNISKQEIETKRTSLSFGSESAVLQGLKLGTSQANPYLFGQTLTAADLYLGYWLIFGISFKIIPYLDEFKAFVERIQSRESMASVAIKI